MIGVRTPQGTWITAYGDADPVAQAPMTDDMHTRTMLMQLMEQGSSRFTTSTSSTSPMETVSHCGCWPT
jgi:hypothetical protein